MRTNVRVRQVLALERGLHLLDIELERFHRLGDTRAALVATLILLDRRGYRDRHLRQARSGGGEDGGREQDRGGKSAGA